MPTSSLSDPDSHQSLRPRWDRERRLLWIDDQLVKSFRRNAPTQANILDVFEEEDWPERIDDPLPWPSVSDPLVARKRAHHRLRTAIQSLNQNHRIEAMSFHCDGTGEAITWRYVVEVLHSQNANPCASHAPRCLPQ